MKNFIIKCFVPSILIEFPSYLNEETSLEIRPIKYIVKIYPQGGGTITTIAKKDGVVRLFPTMLPGRNLISKELFQELF